MKLGFAETGANEKRGAVRGRAGPEKFLTGAED